MREITSHRVNPANDRLSVKVLDEPGAGGANHLYYITGYDVQANPSLGALVKLKERTSGVAVFFQNGPIAEAGLNGITQEVLLAIVVDRLQSFQRGQHACRENAVALTHLETAQLWLHKRTLDRMARGVEGTNQK